MDSYDNSEIIELLKDRIAELESFIASLKIVPVSYFQSNERILMVSTNDTEVLNGRG